MLGSKCDLKMHVPGLRLIGEVIPQISDIMSEIWGITSPINRRPKPPFFRRLRNLAATLTVYIFGMKHDIDNPASALTTTRGFQHLKTTELWCTNSFKLDRHFCPPSENFVSLHCQALQTEISKRNLTKLCQTVDSKSR